MSGTILCFSHRYFFQDTSLDFEVPAVQHIKIEEQRDGKPYTIIRGADLSNQFPDGGMVFNSPVLRADTKESLTFANQITRKSTGFRSEPKVSVGGR